MKPPRFVLLATIFMLATLALSACDQDDEPCGTPGLHADAGPVSHDAGTCDPSANPSQCARCGALPSPLSPQAAICVDDNFSSACPNDGCWICDADTSGNSRWHFIAVDCFPVDAGSDGGH